MEVGFTAAPAPPQEALAASVPDAEACLGEVCEHITTLGLASRCDVALQQGRFSGRLWLPLGLESCNAVPFARWVAAYVIECVNRRARGEHRLAHVDGGPSQFTFWSAPRARLHD
jgi:hypothetical protein